MAMPVSRSVTSDGHSTSKEATAGRILCVNCVVTAGNSSVHCITADCLATRVQLTKIFIHHIIVIAVVINYKIIQQKY